MNREDFPILESNMIYFDNAATTLKPRCVIEKMNEYYLKHTSNIHRGDYDAAVQTNLEYDSVREIIGKFIHADPKCCIYTSGTTMSINMIVFGYMKKHLHRGDEVLLNKELLDLKRDDVSEDDFLEAIIVFVNSIQNSLCDFDLKLTDIMEKQKIDLS